MKQKLRFFFLLIAATMLLSYTHAQQFETVKIYEQVWSAKNIDITVFNNGDPIPEATTKEEWVNAANNALPMWCYYNFDPANAKYGKLYNGFVLEDRVGHLLAPEGWHIANEHDWAILIRNLEGDLYAGPSMKSKSGWSDDLNGDNKSGLNALPGGTCGQGGGFSGLGKASHWWSFERINDGGRMLINTTVLSPSVAEVQHKTRQRSSGCYIRFVKD